MASMLTRRACTALTRQLLTRPRPLLPTRRSIHISPIVHKKKSNALVEDDVFSDDLFAEEEDLIKDTSTDAQTKTTLSASKTTLNELEDTDTPSKAKTVRLTPEERKERFEAFMEYIEARLGRKPVAENPRVRKRSLITVVQLATSEEDLRRVAELLPLFKGKEDRVQPLPDFAERFVRRCEELNCPLLALQVFGNYAKYNLHLTLNAGRALLHSLSPKYPNHVAVVVGLYHTYDLPPISEDLVTACMVALAYTRARPKSPDMKETAESLREPIERMLGQTDFGTKDTEVRRLNNWVKTSLARINKSFYGKGGLPFVNPSLIPLTKETEARAQSS